MTLVLITPNTTHHHSFPTAFKTASPLPSPASCETTPIHVLLNLQTHFPPSNAYCKAAPAMPNPLFLLPPTVTNHISTSTRSASARALTLTSSSNVHSTLLLRSITICALPSSSSNIAVKAVNNHVQRDFPTWWCSVWTAIQVGHRLVKVVASSTFFISVVVDLSVSDSQPTLFSFPFFLSDHFPYPFLNPLTSKPSFSFLLHVCM